ncbi:hypothetical protein [Leisingera sp. ANG-Vp]|uniref:hypothetical protein n=1 Tax=Leisingera sp. ANG-Vp TaxID=1577896 RepID=UPI00126A04A7|nr:hypothetical protein [Leisingera sp. ANG-Vp]
MLKDLDTAPDDPAELRRINTILAAEVKSQALLIEKLQHQLSGHNRYRFGSKSESLEQLNLTFTGRSQHSNGWIGSTTAVCLSLSGTSRRQKQRSISTPL